MATRRWSLNPGDSLEDVVVAVGAATVTKHIELTVDLAAYIVDPIGTVDPRPVKKGEVDTALIILREKIYQDLGFTQ